MNTRGFAASAILVAVTALAASATSLTNGFAYDDTSIIEENPAVHELRAPTAYFSETYWGPARGHVSLYRPLTILAFSVQWAVGDGSPLPFHLVNVALYCAVAVIALALLWQLLPPLGAMFGGLLFAAHPVHVEAVANIVGQAELWVALAVFGGLAAYARERRLGPLRLRTGVLIAAMYFVALFVKEHGIVLPGLVLALEWVGQRTTFARHDGDWSRARILALSLVLLAIIYIAFRLAVLDVLTGDSPYWGLRDLTPPERWTVMLALVPEFARLLFWPARLYADYSPKEVPLLPQLGVAHLPGAAIVLATIATFVVAVRRAPRVAFAVVWFGVTILLVSNFLFPIGVLIAERTLFLPSFSIALVFGAAIAWLAPRAGVRRTALFATLGALIAVATAHSASRQRVWEDTPTVFSTLVVEAPLNFRAHFALGEFYALGGRPAQSDSSFQRSYELYPDHVPARLTHAQMLQVQGRCQEALPILAAARAADPGSAQALVGTAICLLDERRLEEARQLSVLGIARGWSPETLRDVRTLAESLLVSTDTVDARNRWWRAGRPFDRTGKRLRVIVAPRSGPRTPPTNTVQGSTLSATVRAP